MDVDVRISMSIDNRRLAHFNRPGRCMRKKTYSTFYMNKFIRKLHGFIIYYLFLIGSVNL